MGCAGSLNRPLKPAPRLPAEWERQAAVVLTWPRPGGDWDAALPAVEAAMETLAATVGAFEPVLIGVPDAAAGAMLHERLVGRGVPGHHVHTFVVPADDIWARDHGPISVRECTAVVCLDFQFNGWGGKYPADRDNRITARMHALGALAPNRLRPLEPVLEGGAIDTDGEGTILTTSRCLLHPGRNPALDRTDYEALFRRELGATRTLWLKHGWLDGDDTDGHVDMLARFAAPDTIAYTACDDPDDPHYAPLAAMARELECMTGPDGHPYRLVALPWPRAVHDEAGHRLPASYANFLIINDAVVVPAYGIPQDEPARQCIGALFPDRTALSVDARTLLTQGGALHCAAMQLPA